MKYFESLGSLLPSFSETNVPEPITFANFNQDHSCIVVGTNNGFQVYKIVPFQAHPEVDCGGCQFVSMLFSTSLFAIVGRGDSPHNTPRRLRLFNAKSSSQICELNFKDSVLNVKMSKQRMVVVLPDKIHIFDLADMQLLHCLDTPHNNSGLCDFNLAKGQHLLAFPTSNVSGKIMIFDAFNLQVRCCISAHDNPIQHIKFNPAGTLLSSASQRGTIIRICSVETAQILYTFRRGSTPAVISCMAFSKTDDILAVASENNSIHLFNFGKKRKKKKQQSERKPSLTKQLKGYLPPVIKETVVDPKWSFARISVLSPSNSSKEVMCIGFHGTSEELLICTRSGVLYRYSLDVEGGKADLVDEHSVREAEDEEIGTGWRYG